MFIDTQLSNTNYIPNCHPPSSAVSGSVFFDSGDQCMKVYDGSTWHKIDTMATSIVDHDTAQVVDWIMDRMKAEQSIADMSAKYPLVADAIKQLETALKLCSNLDND
jgi:hypothetical protein